MKQSLDKIEQNLMSIYKCNPEWPVCLYDFTFKNRNPNFFSYKVKKDLTAYLRPDYYPVKKACEA
jgi:hypothetical protein